MSRRAQRLPPSEARIRTVSRRIQTGVFAVMMIIALAGVAVRVTTQAHWLVVGIALAAAVGPFTQIAGTDRDGRPGSLTPGKRFGIALLALIAALVLLLAALEDQAVATWVLAGVFWVGIGLIAAGSLLRERLSRGDRAGPADHEAVPPE